MNDPKPYFWNGEYHVFFQHIPDEPRWGKMHWGHMVSRDLVRWETLPVAISPTAGGCDADGCWTGCVVRGERGFHLFYTAIPSLNPFHQVQAVAYSDDLITWTKNPMPVIADPPPGLGSCFRDPQVWREKDGWCMVIGSEQPDGRGGAALLYRSDDLEHWQYLHPLLLGTPATGHDFECPDLFPLGDRHVFLSSRNLTHWQTGAYAERHFTPEHVGVVDGGRVYAAKTLEDDRGRRVLFGWVREPRSFEELKPGGWAGALSLPRELRLLPDGKLGFDPVAELKNLRCSHRSLPPVKFGAPADGAAVFPLTGVHGDTLEIVARMFCGTARRVGLLVRGSPDMRQATPVVLRVDEGMLGDAPLRLGKEEALELRVFIDRSVIEVFANGRAAMTLRTYPPEGCNCVALYAEGGEAQCVSLDVYELGL